MEQILPVASPQRWSSETSLLYQAVSEVRVGNVLADFLHTLFGVRTIEFTKDKGFFLNGERVQIKGVCEHHDLGCLSAAACRRAIQRQKESRPWDSTHDLPIANQPIITVYTQATLTPMLDRERPHRINAGSFCGKAPGGTRA